MHRPTNTWWRRSMVSLSAEFAENFAESSGADVKRSRLEGTIWNFDVEMDSGISGPHVTSRPDEGMSTATTQGGDSHVTCQQRPSACTSARNSRARNASTRSARECTKDQSILVRNRQNTGMLGMRFPAPGKSHTGECRSNQDAWDESRRTASAEEAKRGIVADHWTRMEVRWIPCRRGQKQSLRQTTRLTRWTRTTSEGSQRHFVNWIQST